MVSELHISDHTLTVTERSTFLVRPGLHDLNTDSGSESDYEKDLEAAADGPEVDIRKASVAISVRSARSARSTRSQPERKGWRRFMGFIFTVFHVLAFSSQALVAKLLYDYHPFSLAVWRFQGILLPSLAILVFSQFLQNRSMAEAKPTKKEQKPVLASIWPPTKDGNWKTILFLCIRGFMGCSAVTFFFYGLKYIDIADALVIQAAQPVFINLLAYFVLGEPCGLFPVFLAFLSIIGVGIISRPPLLTGADEFNDQTLIGCGFSTASMLCACGSFVLVRYLKKVHFSILSLSFGVWGSAQSLIGALIIGVFHFPSGVIDIVLTVSLAALTFVAQISLTLALQREEAGPVSLLRTLNCVVGFALQRIFLDVPFDILSLIGASIVLVGVFMTIFKKHLGLLPETHRLRRIFFFVLK